MNSWINVPYEEWAQFILNLLQDRKITEGLVLELGCGTGKLMTLLGKAGFDMIGVDIFCRDAADCQRKDFTGFPLSFTGYERV